MASEDEDDDDEDVEPLRPSGYSRPPAPMVDFAAKPLAELAEAMSRPQQADELPATRPAGATTSNCAAADRLPDLSETRHADEGERRETSGSLGEDRLRLDAGSLHDEGHGATGALHDAAEEDPLAHLGADANATTLISARGPSLSKAPPSRVSVVEADDDPDSDSLLLTASSPGFVPQDHEPPVSSERVVTGALGTRGEESSLMPVVDDLEHGEAEEEQEWEIPGLAARRAKLRKLVGGFVGLLAIAAVGLGVKAATTSASSPAPRSAAAAAPQPVGDAEPARSTRAAAPEAAVAESETEDADSAKPALVLSEARSQVLAHLKAGEHERAEALAHQIIELSPEDAFGYRALGAALQDQGKLAAAREAFSDCVNNAVEGDVGECSALGGAKR